MGISDKVTFTLSCANCGVSESASITDSGSNWSGPHWGGPARFQKFAVTWEGDGGRTEPDVKTAVCIRCGGTAKADSKYGGF